jgi:hypothetical protein
VERIIIIVVVLISTLLLAWRLLRIIKEDDSPCLGCGNSDGSVCSCKKKSNIAGKGADKP